MEHVLFAHCARHPDKVALVCGTQRVTYGELETRIRGLAAGMIARGLKTGDRVVIYLPNCVEFVETLFAVFAAGGVAIPVTTRLTTREVAYFCDDSKAGFLIYSADKAELVAQDILSSRPHVHGFVVGDASGNLISLDELRQPGAPELAPVPVEQDVAAFFYTSGTTGKPKGVVLTHANFIVQHSFMNSVEWRIHGDDNYLVAAPMAHRAGMGRLVNSTMLGGTLSIVSQFDPKQVVDIIEREKVTIFGMVPTMCRLLLPELEKDPARCASIRMMVVTGEAFPVGLKKRMIELLPNMRLVSFFGMTEAGGVTSLSHDEQFTHPESVGRPSPGVEVRIVGVEDGKDVARGEIGELVVRSGQPGSFTVMKSYFNRPDDTTQTLRNGWMFTGDMARIDDAGYVYIVDRKKDMILSGGFNIYSKEVEKTIVEVPGVRDVAVVGVPDEMYGEAVAAFIEYAPDQKPDANAIVEHCKASIAGYKKPKYVFYREALPRNATGKVLKHELIKEAVSELAADAQSGRVA